MLFAVCCESTLSSNSNSTSSASKNKDVYSRLRKLEKKRFTEIARYAKQKGYSIRGFYHTSTWRGFWKFVIGEHLMLMDGRRPVHGDGYMPYENPGAFESYHHYTEPKWASLLEVVDKLYFNVAGPTEKDLEKVKEYVLKRFIPRKGNNTHSSESEDTNQAYQSEVEIDAMHLDKIEFSFNYTIPRRTYENLKDEAKQKEYENDPKNLSEGEAGTLNALQKYCRAEVEAGRKSLVFYMHNKGACCYPRVTKNTLHYPIASWREVMNAFTLEFPSVCMRALMEGYSVCGYGAQSQHYSGNFWWADCGHVAALPTLYTDFDAWKAEFFVLNTTRNMYRGLEFMDNCAYQTFHCKVNHYAKTCPRSSYLDRIQELINATRLPPQKIFHDGVKYEPVESAPLKVCREMVQDIGSGTYADLPYFGEVDLKGESYFEEFKKRQKKKSDK